jgi:RNA polymerase sigma-70 factor (ECF subfamily)
MADRQGSAEGLAGAAAGYLSSGESTRKLLQRARSGDGQALNLLFSRYLMPLERWARGRLPAWARGVADTDDLVQETLLSSLRGVNAFDPHHSGAFQAYLRQGILNRMRDEIRRARRRPRTEMEEEELADPSPSPIEEAIGREALERYEAALQKLKPEDREAILARVELGFGYQQLASFLGKASPDAARMAVTRALVRLSREMAHGRP